MEKTLLWSYPLLIILSMVVMSEVWIDRTLVCLWLLAFLFATMKAQKDGVGLQRRLILYSLYQSPIIIASGVTAFSKLKGVDNEWANGIVQIWTHPFFSLLDLLPGRTIWNLSSTYLLACLTPCVLLLMNVAVYRLVRPIAGK